uniref:Ig-like domain-containing protein n=1 Tax=Chelydra serpentina TaxID=8475 RepID=A0A8C3SPD0_CHESE
GEKLVGALHPPAAPRCSGAQINQTRSLVLEKGHRAQLICEQTYGHDNMFWYRQDPGQALQLLFLFVHKELTDKGNVTDRFQAKRPQTELFHLEISSVKPEDSAVYFCAIEPLTQPQWELIQTEGLAYPIQ